MCETTKIVLYKGHATENVAIELACMGKSDIGITQQGSMAAAADLAYYLYCVCPGSIVEQLEHAILGELKALGHDIHFWDVRAAFDSACSRLLDMKKGEEQ